MPASSRAGSPILQFFSSGNSLWPKRLLKSSRSSMMVVSGAVMGYHDIIHIYNSKPLLSPKGFPATSRREHRGGDPAVRVLATSPHRDRGARSRLQARADAVRRVSFFPRHVLSLGPALAGALSRPGQGA